MSVAVIAATLLGRFSCDCCCDVVVTLVRLCCDVGAVVFVILVVCVVYCFCGMDWNYHAKVRGQRQMCIMDRYMFMCICMCVYVHAHVQKPKCHLFMLVCANLFACMYVYVILTNYVVLCM